MVALLDARAPRGRIGIFFGSWYSEPLVERAFGRLSRALYDRRLSEIAFFEQMLAEDGALVVKLWIHLSKKGLRKRLRRLEDDPATRWKVTKADWKHFREYDRYIEASEHAIRRTDTSHAPWLLVEATEERYRDLMAGRTLLERFRSRLAGAGPAAGPRPPRAASPRRGHEPGGLAHHPRPCGPQEEAPPRGVRAAAREGAGSPGSPGARRLREEALLGGGVRGLGRLGQGREHPPDHRRDGPAHVPGHPGGRAHRRGEGAPLLWRFWRHVPRAGYVTVYDRSWYGRVLVERVEGFARPDEWSRAYLEINDFEEQLAAHGTVLAKFWLQIDAKEQLRRFRERETVAWKRHKIGPEDWRNREKWDAYEEAVST